MSLVMGIVGLPNVGKSSLFNALTNQSVLVENRPFATINPNLGVVNYVDSRLTKLAELVHPDKVVYSCVKFLDIAGLVKGASQGDGLGNKFLEHIRSVDAICLVVRAFDDDEILSVNSCVDPICEVQIIVCELIYADIEMINRIVQKLKSNDPLIETLERIRKHLINNQMISSFELTEEEKKKLSIYSFLTDKPMIILANVDDKESSISHRNKAEEYAKTIGSEFLSLNIKLEHELNSLGKDDRDELLRLMGLEGSCLDRLISLSYRLLNCRSFFTVGKKEVRSWMFKNGWTAPKCASVIHSDMERGFIKAEVYRYEDFIEFGSIKELKNRGKVRLEGADYLMQDGDIVNFIFSV